MKPSASRAKTFVIVAYDISDDKRRTKLHRRLKRFGLGVQYSVFECLLSPTQLAAMKKTIKQSINTQKGDRVRYFFLCEACRKRIEATDRIARQDDPAVFV